MNGNYALHWGAPWQREETKLDAKDLMPKGWKAYQVSDRELSASCGNMIMLMRVSRDRLQIAVYGNLPDARTGAAYYNTAGNIFMGGITVAIRRGTDVIKREIRGRLYKEVRSQRSLYMRRRQERQAEIARIKDQRERFAGLHEEMSGGWRHLEYSNSLRLDGTGNFSADISARAIHPAYGADCYSVEVRFSTHDQEKLIEVGRLISEMKKVVVWERKVRCL